MAVVYPGTEELFKPRVAAVRGGLKDEGMVEGRDYVLDVRFASGDFSQLSRLAQELEALKKRFPELGKLAYQREALRGLFNDRAIRNPAAGRERLQAWMEQAKTLGVTALNKFFKTLTNWLDKIANYFHSRSRNGRTEGFNHGLRSILWRAFGMTNFANFRLRVLHCFGFASA